MRADLLIHAHLLRILVVGTCLCACSRSEGATIRAPLPSVLPGTGFPVRVAMSGGPIVEIEAPPTRVLLANANFVDMVTRILPPDRIVALPEQSTTWTRLAEVDDGFRAKATFRQIDVERVVALQPDLVLCSPFNVTLVDGAGADFDVPTLIVREPHDLDELTSVVSLLGRVLDRETAARELLAEIAARVEVLRSRSGARRRLGVVTYSNYGGSGWTNGAETMADQMLRLAGLQNLAASAGKRGHERITFEELIAIDPDFIVIADRVGEASSGTDKVLRNEPVLQHLRAVTDGRILALHPRFFATSSQEIVTGAERLARAVEHALAESGR